MSLLHALFVDLEKIMPNHMLLMSFDGSSILNIVYILNRFSEYMAVILQKKECVNFCYIGTATNDRLTDRLFFLTFMRLKFGKSINTSKLLLSTEITENQIEHHLSRQDVIFVGGGNTEQMLTIWKHRGFTNVLNKFKQDNRLPLLAGVSAGGMYPFNSGLTDSTPDQYSPLQCLDWLKHSFCPHADSKIKALCIYDSNKRLERMHAYKSAIKMGQLPPGYAVPNNCMLHFYNFNLVRALTSIKDNTCSYVTKHSVEPIETLLLTKQNTYKTAFDALIYLGLNLDPHNVLSDTRS